ncbi:MAG: Pr6Pr family membrane protein [Coriobacteriia bacterium]|nr:Pr6Pr family membrane protein [Coriobacteriia bacterium]
MRIHSNMCSLIWKLIMIVVGGYTLFTQVFPADVGFNVVFFHYFTNLSGLLLVFYLVADLIAVAACGKQGEAASVTLARPLLPGLKHAITLSIMVTGLVGHFMLFDKLFEGGFLHGELVVLHYMIPIMFLLDWLLFDEKGTMTWKGPIGWLGIPLLYFAGVIAVVQLTGLGLGMDWAAASAAGTAVVGQVSRYPYFFIDLDALGIGGVALYVVVLLAVFAALGYVLVLIDRLMAKHAKK